MMIRRGTNPGKRNEFKIMFLWPSRSRKAVPFGTIGSQRGCILEFQVFAEGNWHQGHCNK